jgi:hypothetical protein
LVSIVGAAVLAAVLTSPTGASATEVGQAAWRPWRWVETLVATILDRLAGSGDPRGTSSSAEVSGPSFTTGYDTPDTGPDMDPNGLHSFNPELGTDTGPGMDPDG